LPKRGPTLNELTKFRYQVVLLVRDKVREFEPDRWHDWRAEGLSLTGTEEMLREKKPDYVAIHGVPNHRLSHENRLLKLLETAQEGERVGELKERFAMLKPVGITAEQLEQVAVAVGYHLAFSFAMHDRNGDYQVLFTRTPQQLDAFQFPGKQTELSP